MLLSLLYEGFRVAEVVAVTVLYGYLRKQWDVTSPITLLTVQVSYTCILAAALAYRVARREQAYKIRRSYVLLMVVLLHFALMALGFQAAALVLFIGLAVLSVYCNELLPVDIVQFRPYETQIRQFYFEHNPAMLHNVDALLDKHKGRERELYERIKNKYAMNDDDGEEDDSPFEALPRQQPRPQAVDEMPASFPGRRGLVEDEYDDDAQDTSEVDRAREEARRQMQQRTEAAIASMRR